jgi:hypothetical protein
MQGRREWVLRGQPVLDRDDYGAKRRHQCNSVLLLGKNTPDDESAAMDIEKCGCQAACAHRSKNTHGYGWISLATGNGVILNV